jgi:hypothetical protein
MALLSGGLEGIFGGMNTQPITQPTTTTTTSTPPPSTTLETTSTTTNPMQSWNWNYGGEQILPGLMSDGNTLESALRSAGYTGGLTQENQYGWEDPVSGQTQQRWNTGISDDLTKWLNDQQYQLGWSYGDNPNPSAGGELYYGLFDQNKNLMGTSSEGYSNSGTWIEPLVIATLGAIAGGAGGLWGDPGSMGGATGGISGTEAAASNGLWDVAGGSALEGGAAGVGGAAAGSPLAAGTANAVTGSVATSAPAIEAAAAANAGLPAGAAAGAVGTGSGGLTLGGAGAAASGAGSIFNAAKDSQAANEQLGLPANTGGVPSSVDLGSLGGSMSTGAGGLGGLLSSLPKGMQDGLSSLFNNLTSPQGLSGLLGMYNANQQNNMLKDRLGEMDRMFSTDSPYAKQMQETLARKDAAAGRNSQYGPRAEKLAADLTTRKADMYKDIMALHDRMSVNMDSRIKDLAGIFGSGNSGQSIFGGLSGLSSGFQELMKLFGD